MREGIESVLVRTRGDDGLVVLGRGVEVVIVVVEPRVGEPLGLALGEHAEGDARFHAEVAHRLDHLDHAAEIAVGG